MQKIEIAQHVDFENDIRRWRDLFKLGSIFCIIVAALVIFAIIAYLIWPFSVGVASTEEIFITLQNDRLGALMSLDLLLLLIQLLTIPPLLALFMALKNVNESYALIALVIGLLAVVLVVPARPLAELVYLSDQYALATTEAVRNQFLLAGETLLAIFNGTTWMVFTIFVGLSGLISSILMLQSRYFSKTAAYIGIACSLPGFGFFIPVAGPILLFIATIGGVLWYLIIARVFFQLGFGD